MLDVVFRDQGTMDVGLASRTLAGALFLFVERKGRCWESFLFAGVGVRICSSITLKHVLKCLFMDKSVSLLESWLMLAEIAESLLRTCRTK